MKPSILLSILSVLGCSDHDYDLAYLPSTGNNETIDMAPTSIAGVDIGHIAEVVNERPGGAASLGEGTSGGGLFEDALNTGRLIEVQTTTELVEAVAGETPRILLVHPGEYDLGEEQAYEVETCRLPCSSGDTRETETQPAGKCGDGAAVEILQSRTRRLRIGSNKTVLGLGTGATLFNVELELSGSQNIILRNLEITEVNPGIVGAGEAILMWPSHHVWIDHCSFSNSSHTFINIHSSWDQESPTYALTDIASQITLSYNSFFGFSEDSCNGRQHWVVGTQRDPALTVDHNVMIGGDQANPYLFGPETWGHVYNNFVEDVTAYGVGVSCGAIGLIEANVFERNEFALNISHEGDSSWPFCSAELYGTAWFPTEDADESVNNLVDADSGMNANGQPLDGGTIDLPTADGATRSVRVPLPSGFDSYQYELEAVSETWAQELVEKGGVGKLF